MESRQCILRRIELHSSRESPKSIRQAHCLIAGRLARERESYPISLRRTERLPAYAVRSPLRFALFFLFYIETFLLQSMPTSGQDL
ncbi:unnamed protein product [Coffea canephora]|uniref:DH200=94 genomic scaffold, scaffold_159 n=1 Tax=Coffea canephora TaxID=49390 RepID=A0A068V9R9_COFCA|nr:unnamed protein product [Coffea canephora]